MSAAAALLGVVAALVAAPDPAVRAELVRTATSYYDAFRLDRLDEACALVAPRWLPTIHLVGVNFGPGSGAGAPRIRARRQGCAGVRQRRRGWEEPMPRRLWRVEDVSVDRSGTRARVDTSAEGSYWMRRTRAGWRIVAFGSLTPAGVRRLGGRWVRSPFGAG